jgi:high-affinity Fe2+/Pb2+ permease
MENQMQVQEQKQTQANRTAAILAIGGGIGAAIGLVASYIVIKNIVEVEDRQFTPMTGVKLGLAVMGLLRILAG